MSDTPAPERMRVHRARLADMTTADLYDILRLRSQVFVVEQGCVYLDADGRDSEPSTEHLWVRDDRGVAATLRMLDEGDGEWSIGRVVARPDVRSRGVASWLLEQAIGQLDAAGCPAIRLGAQAHLSGWYGRFGFVVSGPGYVEDGIPHVPMRREAGSRSGS